MRSVDGFVAAALFAAALLLAPVATRRSYAAAARTDFADEYARRRAETSAFAAVAYAAGAILDAIASAFVERIGMLQRACVHAWRSARRTPAYSTVIVLTMAVAIGANVAIDSLLGHVFLAGLPFADPASLVSVWETNAGADVHWGLSYDDANAVIAGSRTLDAAYTEAVGGLLRGVGRAQVVGGVAVSGSYFRVMRFAPQLGRGLTAKDERSRAAVMVLSDSMWREVFEADPHVVGRVVTLGEGPRTIVGVARPGSYTPDAWRGTIAQYAYYVPMTDADRGAGHQYEMVARLRPGASIEAAASDLSRIFDERKRRHPETNALISAKPHGMTEEIFGELRTIAVAVAGVALALLLIACVNVANLLLARGSSRSGEITIRYSLGATRGAIVAQLLSETMVYALVAGAVGFVLAALAFPILAKIIPPMFAYAGTFAADGRTALVTLAIVTATALLAGLVPALTLSKRDLSDGLKRSGRSGSLGAGASIRSALTAAEIAMTVGVVVVAGLALRTLDARTHEPLGYVPVDRYVIAVPSGPTPITTSEAEIRLLAGVQRAIGAVPGIDGIAASFAIPNFSTPKTSFTIEGEHIAPGHEPGAMFNMIAPTFFRVMGTPLLAGRAFRDDDRLGSTPVAIVSAAFARVHFGGVEGALGKRITFGFSSAGQAQIPRTIVGVAGDIRLNPQRDFEPAAYMPAYQMPYVGGQATFVMHARIPRATLANTVRDAIARFDPTVPQAYTAGLEKLNAQNLAGLQTIDLIVGLLAAIALVLALAGVFAVIAYGVARRSHEIGIRLALGAAPRAVILLILRGTAVPAAVGVVLGVPLAAMGAKALDGSIIERGMLAPFEEVALVGFVVASVVIAAYIPARRAARVDPLVAVRYE